MVFLKEKPVRECLIKLFQRRENKQDIKVEDSLIFLGLT